MKKEDFKRREIRPISPMTNLTRLFGRQTKQDWLNLRTIILTNPDKIEHWKEAIELLDQRLETRYFRPINKILRMRTTTGEGFAVMTLICSLMEFLQSCYEGKMYKHGAKETKIIYGVSGPKFKSFLEQQMPFKIVFNKSLADDFYTNVRCGLLHEAATNNGWVIKISKSSDENPDFVDVKTEGSKVIYRDKFFEAIKMYYANYKQEIIDNKKDSSNQSLRDNFCRKLDCLCVIDDKSVAWWF